LIAEAQVQERELDGGPSKAAPGSERACALTREVKPVDRLIRFVLGPSGEVVPDVKRKLPGRGLWVTGTRAAVEQAVRRNVFARGFRRDVRVARDLADRSEDLLARAALDALAIAGKAGLVVTGFSKVEAALKNDEVLALIHAAEAAADGRRKLDLRRHDGGTRPLTVIDVFSGPRLDLALNRPNVVHAALLAGPGSETFLARAARLVRFRTTTSPDAVHADAPTEAHKETDTE
jgi:predicted RNA-binding protein YlxR (DUF448 family)